MIKNILTISLSLLTIWSLNAQTFYGDQNTIFQFEQYGACKIYTCDIDGDGDTDVLSATKTNDTIAWYENTDGNGTFGEPQIICDTAYDVCSISACDMDGDGDQDVLSASSNGIAWYENTDGDGTFGSQEIISGTACLVYACDIDGDGDQDVLKAQDYELAWHENTDGAGTFGEEQFIDQSVNVASLIFPCDMDGDGDQDILLATRGYWITSQNDYIIWYENTDGNGTFERQQKIVNSISGVQEIYACDIDGDGDKDVLSATVSNSSNGLFSGGYQIVWYENTDGNGTFGAQQVIINEWKESPRDPYAVVSVYTYDIDGDGDQDVLSATSPDDKIAWYMNTDGNGTFDGDQAIVTSTNFPRSAQVCDIDGDGNQDVISVSSFSKNNIAWYENFTAIIVTQPTDETICPGSNAEFSLTANDVETYQWQLDEGTGFTDLTDNSVYSGVTTHTLTMSSPGNGMDGYQYHCILSNPGGSVQSDTVVLGFDNISPEITSIHEDILIDADSDCEAILSDYTGEVTATDNCDTELNVTQNPIAGTTISGQTNTVTLTVTDDMGNTDEVTFNVAVEDNTNPTISCVGNQIVVADETYYYAVSGTEFDPVETSDNCGAVSVENDFTNSATLAGAQIPQGTTTITWIIADNAGNENICSFDITVSASFVGVEQLQQKGISIFPNPTNGVIHFEFTNNNIQQITIFDITGNQIMDKTPVQQNETLDLSGFESGIYMIGIQIGKEILTIKIVKE